MLPNQGRPILFVPEVEAEYANLDWAEVTPFGWALVKDADQYQSYRNLLGSINSRLNLNSATIGIEKSFEVVLAGRTQNTLALTNLQPVDEGDYTVVITNVAGAVTSEAARLWVVPLASELVKSNLTNQAGVRLPYFYLLPTNYTAARRYPLLLYFHGGTGDETMITTPGYGYPGYANLP